VKIPETLESAIDAAVTRHLETELGDRGLLLSSADLAVAEAKTATLGGRLMTSVLKQCYPKADGLTVEFERGGDIARIGAALAFGAATSSVLASSLGDGSHRQIVAEFVCGTFNLGIGLVDGVCDADAAMGGELLDHFQGADLIGAAEDRRGPGWLHAGMPLHLAADAGVAFTVSVTEAFFENLHGLYADESDVRRIVGEQLADALEAETASVRRPLAGLSAERRVECSRATSVLPFEIIETITIGGRAPATPSAATLLGEAMWRIDDLVDLSEDARSGALNAVLLEAFEWRGRHDRYDIADLEAVLASSGIASAAAEAADHLRDGLRLAGVVIRDDRDAFLQFVQRYAGIDPAS
jgi:hypothetical protein